MKDLLILSTVWVHEGVHGNSDCGEANDADGDYGAQDATVNLESSESALGKPGDNLVQSVVFTRRGNTGSSSRRQQATSRGPTHSTPKLAAPMPLHRLRRDLATVWQRPHKQQHTETPAVIGR